MGRANGIMYTRIYCNHGLKPMAKIWLGPTALLKLCGNNMEGGRIKKRSASASLRQVDSR